MPRGWAILSMVARESLRSFEKAIAEWLETMPAEEAAKWAHGEATKAYA